MAWEVRVGVAKQSPAAPNFPITIFVEIQTNGMSTGLTNFNRTPRSIFSFPLYIISTTQTGSHRLKRFGRGLGEPEFA